MFAGARPTIICISGKRYAGKDTFATKLSNDIRHHLPDRDTKDIIFFPTAAWVKKEVAERSNGAISLSKLLYDTTYKEMHRHAIIEHGERMRVERGDTYWIDQSIACWRNMVKDYPNLYIIVTDLRFLAEYNRIVEQCKDTFSIFTVRVEADDETRRARGWVYDPAIDNSVTETELDHHLFDYTIQ